MTVKEIKDTLSKLDGMDVEEPIGNVVEGEYKKYSFVINEYDVKVNKKISGEKPTRRSNKLK